MQQYMRSNTYFSGVTKKSYTAIGCDTLRPPSCQWSVQAIPFLRESMCGTPAIAALIRVAMVSACEDI